MLQPALTPTQALNVRLQRIMLRRVVERSRYENYTLRSILTNWRRSQRAIVQLVRTSGVFSAERRSAARREGLGLVWPDRRAHLARLLDTIAGIVGAMSLHAMTALRRDLPALVELEVRELPQQINAELEHTADQLAEADDDSAIVLQEYIVKVKAGYRIISHRTGKNLGTFRTRAAAKRHLAHLAKFREDTGQEPTEHDLERLLVEAPTAVAGAFNVAPLAALTELLGTPLGGAHFATSFGDLSATVLMRLRNTLVTGLMQGQSVPTVSRGVSGVLDNTRWQAERIVRSEYGRVANQAALAQYDANQALLRGVQWVATLDQRTCLQCGKLDRQFWASARSAKIPVADTHPNCRCTLVPVVKSLPGVTAPAGQRASMAGEVPATVSYKSWFGDQSPTLQREILGPTRFNLWRQGKVGLPDFVSASGVRSVHDVLQGLKNP